MSELLYGVDDQPPPPQAALAALAHVLAIVAGIATPPLLIALALGFDDATTLYLIATALTISGAATLLQCRGLGPLGSRLLSVQGTSFAFIGAMILGWQMLAPQGLRMANGWVCCWARRRLPR